MGSQEIPPKSLEGSAQPVDPQQRAPLSCCMPSLEGNAHPGMPRLEKPSGTQLKPQDFFDQSFVFTRGVGEMNCNPLLPREGKEWFQFPLERRMLTALWGCGVPQRNRLNVYSKKARYI